MLEKQIAEQVIQSKAARRTTNALQQFILKVVHESLSQHYNSNYSDRCFQSSIIIKDILDTLDVKSVIVTGALCLPRVIGTSPYQLSWNGFWDKDHHVWLITEFYEIVDLTVSQLHLHTLNVKHQAHPVPPIWWYPGDCTPSMLKYLPTMKSPVLEDEYKDDLERLRKIVQQKISGTLSEYDLKPILHGMESLEELLGKGDHWATGVLVLQQMNLPLPDWVALRERELLGDR